MYFLPFRHSSYQQMADKNLLEFFEVSEITGMIGIYFDL